jgi:hypothetical protein
MCNLSTCSHDALNDDLDDIFRRADCRRSDRAGSTSSARRRSDRFEEKCLACGGSGQFRSYTGRVVGSATARARAEQLFYKTSLEQREKARAAAERRKGF